VPFEAVDRAAHGRRQRGTQRDQVDPLSAATCRHTRTVRERTRRVKPPRAATSAANTVPDVTADRTELEIAYSPSSCVDDVDALIAAYGTLSAAARAAHPPVSHAYGALPCERLDLFSAGPGTPLHVFVHGGYWQELGKDDSSFPATGLLAAGVSFAAIDYGLAPHYTLEQIVEQVRAALAWIMRNAAVLDVDVSRLVLSGSSAGAHLAAMAALTDWPARGCPAEPIGGLVLLSGVYDLRPLVQTYINDAVGMTAQDAVRNSPLLQLPEHGVSTPAVVAWGEHETAAFKQQSARFADAWAAAGGPVTRLEATGRNHFDIVPDLADPATPLGAAVARLHADLAAAG
jgi:arylformamidase